MLIAFLMQAAVSAAPAPPPPTMEELVRNLQATGLAQRSTRCRNLVVEVMRPHLGERVDEIVPGASGFERRGAPMGAQPPVWVPGANPEEGYYAAVDRQLDGCPVPTPIYLPNAPSPAGKE